RTAAPACQTQPVTEARYLKIAAASIGAQWNRPLSVQSSATIRSGVKSSTTQTPTWWDTGSVLNALFHKRGGSRKALMIQLSVVRVRLCRARPSFHPRPPFSTFCVAQKQTPHPLSRMGGLEFKLDDDLLSH